MITKTHTRPYLRRPGRKSKTDYFLRTALPKNFQLIDSIHQLIDTVNAQHPLCIELIHCGFENGACLRQEDNVSIYLIVKAQIRNILKNTEATSATIHLAKNFDQVAIVVEDNGLAADITKTKNNRALRIINNLVRHHKGQYNVVFEHDKGTVLETLIGVTELSKD